MGESFVPRGQRQLHPEPSYHSPVKATEFFREFNPDVMREVECTQMVLDFRPSAEQFLQILGPPGVVLFVFATFGFVLLVGLFIDTLVRCHRIIPADHKFSASVVLSVYPVLGLCSYLGVIFPKSNAFMDACAQLWFSLCMLQFFKLTLLYFGGESEFVEHMEGKTLPWRGPPCCCWPCCWPFCPTTPVTKRQVTVIRMLVMQHPFVQSILSIIGLALWVEGHYTQGDYRPLSNAFVYIFVITTTSFLFALWAFIVGFKASIPELTQFHYKMKAVTFQLSLIFLRFQSLIFNFILLPFGIIPCLPPISPAVFSNAMLCALLLGQLVILSVIARHYYTLPTPVSMSHIKRGEEAGNATELILQVLNANNNDSVQTETEEEDVKPHRSNAGDGHRKKRRRSRRRSPAADGCKKPKRYSASEVNLDLSDDSTVKFQKL